MSEAKIIDRGRGPEIAGTRITVYDVLDYLQEGCEAAWIAALFSLEVSQIEAAAAYIDEHRNEVMADYQDMLEFAAKGNSPEVRAKLDASHAKLMEMVRQRKRAVANGEADAGRRCG
jgi:uncharacterized protein (DUF433 family)